MPFERSGERRRQKFGVLEREVDPDLPTVLAQRIALDDMFLRSGWQAGTRERRAMIGEKRGIHNQDIAIPVADGVTLIGSLAVLRMSPAIRVDGAFDIEKLVVNSDSIIVNGYLV